MIENVAFAALALWFVVVLAHGLYRSMKEWHAP